MMTQSIDAPSKRLRFCLMLCLAPVVSATPLQDAVDRAAADTRAEFASPALTPDQLAVTVLDLRGTAPVRAHYRGDERFYPASVIKLFYLAATHRWLEDGRLADTPRLRFLGDFPQQ